MKRVTPDITRGDLNQIEGGPFQEKKISKKVAQCRKRKTFCNNLDASPGIRLVEQIEQKVRRVRVSSKKKKKQVTGIVWHFY